ncbi:hypothetical protein LUZ60_010482 [Juncus effusus]|nr:hypothetical protein LUZ60_010482 [Juncus effusus]
MPPPPVLTLTLTLTLITLLSSPASSSPPPPPPPLPPPPSCSPFRSAVLPFPFATSPHFGHPSFHINCSYPHSILSISSSPFLLLDYSASSLLLSPILSSSTACPSLPFRPLTLSGSPFHVSSDTCNRLASLQFCPSPAQNTSSPCELTSFQQRLVPHPNLLLTSCKTTSRNSTSLNLTHPPCAKDMPSSISGFLKAGIWVEFDPLTDPYYNNCSSCTGICGYNNSLSSKPFICFPSDKSSSFLTRQTNNHTKTNTPSQRVAKHLLLLTTISFALICIIVLLILYFSVRYWYRLTLSSRTGTGTEVNRMLAFLRYHNLQPPIFTYDQLRVATSDFDPLRKIGDGGFGSVYLGIFSDGHFAAVKRLHKHHPEAASASRTTKSFYNEILILSSLRHPNLVRLHGYCADPRGLLLVYDYVPNGTLAEQLHGYRRISLGLDWSTRLSIALQTATALDYLHFSSKPPVVHRDITSSNIFMDSDMRVRLGDFGLSRLLNCPDACSLTGTRELVSCTGPQGTPGYLDPDYFKSFRLDEKSDVYSFGVVLLELVTGLRAVDLERERREITLAEFVVGKILTGELGKVVDRVLVGGEREKEVRESVEAVSELAFRCVAGEKDDRPDANELVEELKRIKGKFGE